MLSRLYVKNIALIEEADIVFGNGFNVLSGETGSGKSVILDSINFVLGSKADKTMIRYGESEAVVKAEFVIDENSEAKKALDELDIETDGEVVITRKFSSDGKSSIKINGNGVTATMLKSVTSHLVDVHGQSEHFFLLNESNQIKVIDGLCPEIPALKLELGELIAQKKEIKRNIEMLGGDERRRADRQDYLEYQINEIKKADIRVGEYDELKEKQNLIRNTEKILTALGAIKCCFSDDGGCIDTLSTAVRQFSSVSDIKSEYSELYERLENLRVEAEDISETAEDFADELSFDEQEAAAVEERIAIINGLRKKYGANEAEILSYLEKAETEYDDLTNATERIEKLNKETAKINKKIYDICQKLTKLRKNQSEIFSKNVIKELKTLNIPNAEFAVEFNDYDFETANLDGKNGSDELKFTFSANKGEPLKPLSKVISGGEMSRFMLAVKTQLKELNGISTYIFDEIDAGISGYTAKSVAEKFKAVSKSTQIIAVSHLPQVCAASDNQFLIYKEDEKGKTVTHIKKLTDEEKIDEIVRLTGSVNSAAAREHASELISQFKS